MTEPQSPVAHPDGSSSANPARGHQAWTLDPATTAAVIVDVQRLFTDMVAAPIAPPLNVVLPAIGKFVEDSRRIGITVVVVRTIIAPEAHSRSTAHWPEFMRAGMAPGAPGTDFDPCLNVQPTDIEIVKPRYSAFFGTPLSNVLRDRGIETVVIAGLTTNVCVQSTARDAWQHDFHTITLDDCCAEVGDRSHADSLAWTSRNFGVVCSSSDLQKRMRVAARANG